MNKTIKRGNRGNAVKSLQQLLNIEPIGQADGIFGKLTLAAVKEFQKNNNLKQDGIVGADTWTALGKSAPTCSTSKNNNSVYVCSIQVELNMEEVNGKYDSKTKAAVVAYQSANGLSADGICGPITWMALLTDKTPSQNNDKKFIQPVDYKQGDSRWGNKMYSNHNNKNQTMANSGCGPTAMADIVATVKDSKIDPYDLAVLSMENGHRSYSGGTAWAFFKFIADKFNFSKFIQTSSLKTMKACLDAGGYVVCSMGPGYWTKGGHFICAWKYDDTYMYANDPASKTRKRQKESSFYSQRKQFFCFYK